MSSKDLSGFYRKGELRSLTGLSDSTIWRMEKLGTFPSRKKISDRLVGWNKKEISEWIMSRANA